MVTCPDCQHVAPLEFENLKLEPGKPEIAHLVCEECGVVQDEAIRRAMLESGKWVATAEGEQGIRSYHLNELASKFSTLKKVAADFEAAKTPEERQAFYNTSLARVYDAGTEVELSSSDLQQRAEPLTPPYSANVAFVTAGVDVQSDRVEVTFLAHHSDGTASVLNHLKLMGDTSGDAVWLELDTALGTTFPRADGGALDIQMTAVDSGFNADQVLKFVHAQRRKSRTVYPIKGVGGFDRLPLAKGGRLKGQTQLLAVGVDRVKQEVQKRLAMQEMGPGYIRLPSHLPSEYFDGLASEELRVRYVKGAPRHEYHRTYRQNEPFDCLIYAVAIAKAVDVQKVNKPATPAFDPQAYAKAAAQLNSRAQQ
jgi:phage terminase large subunit GpA-like protein